VLDFFTAFLAMLFRVAFFAATLPPDLFAISDECPHCDASGV
jgi:hypothetical protein